MSVRIPIKILVIAGLASENLINKSVIIFCLEIAILFCVAVLTCMQYKDSWKGPCYTSADFVEFVYINIYKGI